MMEETRTQPADLDECEAGPALPGGTNGPSFVADDDATEAPADPEHAGTANTSLDPTDPMARRNGKDAEDETRPLTLPPVDLDVERLGDKRLLELAIEASPDPMFPGRHLPATRFAIDIALCTDRTLRRYQEGTRGLPNLLREKLRGIVLDAQKKAARKAPR